MVDSGGGYTVGTHTLSQENHCVFLLDVTEIYKVKSLLNDTTVG